MTLLFKLFSQAWTNYLWQKRVVFYLVLSAGAMVAFLPVETGIQPQMNDKLLHFSSFIVIAALCHVAHPQTSLIIQFIGLALFGLGIELVQAELPYRMFSLLDLAANVAGLLVYYLMFVNLLIFASTRRAQGQNNKASPD